MFYYSVDDLMSDVNRVALLPNIEELRSPCIKHIQTVYRKIGSDKVKIPMVADYVPTHGTIVLPETVYKVNDVGINGIGLRETRTEDGCFYTNSVSFKQDGNKIRLSNAYNNQVVSVSYWSLPVDDNNELLIDSRIYDAVVAFCRAEELMVKGANVKQERATLNPAVIYKQEANRLIDEARAGLNEMSWGEWRDLIMHLQGEQKIRYYNNYNLYYQTDELARHMGK